jgi:hypothetical protein
LVTTSELSNGSSPPLVSSRSSSPDTTGGSVLQTLDEIAQDQPLQFTGDCAVPKRGDCRARFAMAFRRLDDGAAGGKVTVNWSFDVASSGQRPAATASTTDPQDPPWTVQITAP